MTAFVLVFIYASENMKNDEPFGDQSLPIQEQMHMFAFLVTFRGKTKMRCSNFEERF